MGSLFLLAQPFNVIHIDAIGSFDGQPKSTCPNIIGQTTKSSRHPEYHRIEVILLHT